jgi:hypothetical protein
VHLDRAIAADLDYDYAPRTKARVLARLGRVTEHARFLAAAVLARPQSVFRWHAQAMFELDTEDLPERDLAGAAVAARRAIGLSESTGTSTIGISCACWRQLTAGQRCATSARSCSGP